MRLPSSFVLACVLGSSIACNATHADRSTRTPDAPRVAGLGAEASRLLAAVPADTPYVWLNAEPLPDAYVERLADLRDRTMVAWARVLDRPTHDREHAALADAFRGRMNPEGLRGLGFATNPRFVLYGLGLAPVLRLELADGRRVAALIETIDAADGRSQVRTIEGHPVWTSEGDDRVAAAIAVVGDTLVVTAYPRAVEAELLPRALGVVPPATSLAHGDWYRIARRDHDLLPHGLAMVDLRRLVEIAAGEGDELSRTVARSWGVSAPSVACTTALEQWVARAPRLWSGLREIDARTISAATIWELDRDLRDDLREVVAPIPGQRRGDRDDGIASVGVGIDVGAALEMFGRWRADDRLAACDELARSFSDDAAPAWVTDLRGGSAVLHSWDPQRTRATGVVVIGVDDPLAWLRTVAPNVDLVPLERAHRAAPLSAITGSLLASLWGEVWVARGRHSLGVASGDGARRTVARVARREATDRHTMVTWQVDLHGLLASSRADRERADAAWSQAWAAFDATRRIRGALEVGAHGLELTAILELARTSP